MLSIALERTESEGEREGERKRDEEKERRRERVRESSGFTIQRKFLEISS